MVLPVDAAVVTLEAGVLAVAVVESLVAAVVGLDVVDTGRDVDGAVAGLEAQKNKETCFCGTRKSSQKAQKHAGMKHRAPPKCISKH